MTAVRETLLQLRSQAKASVRAAVQRVSDAEATLGEARMDLQDSLRDAADIGIGVDELADLTGLSGSTVRKYMASAAPLPPDRPEPILAPADFGKEQT